MDGPRNEFYMVANTFNNSSRMGWVIIYMLDIDKIYNMLSWNNDMETQTKGIEEAKKIKSLWVFIFPILPTSSKDVWENCAKVLITKTDTELSPYYYNLLNCLQDLNWPGASLIYDRLSNVRDESFDSTLLSCLKTAKDNMDTSWQYALNALAKDREKNTIKRDKEQFSD